MLGFYGVVKATTGANPAPTLTHTPPFGHVFLSVNLSLGKSAEPPPPTSGPPGDEIITLKVGWSARNASSRGGGQCVWPGNSLRQRKKYTAASGSENCDVGRKTTRPCLWSAACDGGALRCCRSAQTQVIWTLDAPPKTSLSLAVVETKWTILLNGAFSKECAPLPLFGGTYLVFFFLPEVLKSGFVIFLISCYPSAAIWAPCAPGSWMMANNRFHYSSPVRMMGAEEKLYSAGDAQEDGVYMIFSSRS